MLACYEVHLDESREPTHIVWASNETFARSWVGATLVGQTFTLKKASKPYPVCSAGVVRRVVPGGEMPTSRGRKRRHYRRVTILPLRKQEDVSCLTQQHRRPLSSTV